ncbi:MAG: CBS domain-containing protein [Planctomycetes bacterium]|nr:CBS domain-containing protein [Planctomycetota bacterium]
MVDKEQFGDMSTIQKSDFYTTHAMPSSRVWMKVSKVMSKEVLTVAPDETVASAAMVMSKNNVSCILILENDNVTGILTEDDLLKKAIVGCKDANQMVVTEVMSSPVVTVPSDCSVLAASRIMEDKHIKRLPVMAENKLLGIVTQTDLTRLLTYYGTWRDISEVMTEDISGIQKNTSVAKAAAVMASRDISSIAVLEDEKVVGILTERDLLSRVIALRKDPDHIETEEVMTSPVISVPSSYSIFSASKTMEKMNIRRLVVMDEGRLCGIVTQTDIFMAIKNKLQSEEENNLRLLDQSKSAIYTTDLDYVMTYANPAFTELFEVSDPQEFINQPFLPERFWFDLKEREQFLAEVKEDCFESRELTLKTSTGKKIYVTVFSTFIKVLHGETIGTQGIVYDITAKKELAILKEQALRQSEKKWRLMAENIPDVIFAVGKEGKIQFLNRLKTGTAPESMIGTSIYEYMSPDQREIMRESIERAFETGKVGNFEIGWHSGHGAETIWKTRVVPVIENGEVVSVNLISTEITERRKAERRHLEQLATGIIERRKVERRREELLEQLEGINCELEDVTNIASHDSQKPQRGFQALAEWLSDDCADKLDEKGKERLDLILDRMSRMQELIDDILKYSTVGYPAEQKAQINLNELIPQIIEMVSAPQKIAIDVEDELPVIESEPTRITWIFQILLSNAVKYMDKSQGQIRINCVEEEVYFKFSVADNGPGIEEEIFGNIFRMFENHSPQDKFESTGIGLSLVMKIVETYGGKIWVESELGKGTTFFFILPKQNCEVMDAKLQTCTVGWK